MKAPGEQYAERRRGKAPLQTYLDAQDSHPPRLFFCIDGVAETPVEKILVNGRGEGERSA